MSSTPKTRLFLLRHAEVEARYQRIFGGRIDMDLSPAGRRQAEALGAYRRRIPFDALYCSPLKRARETLVPVQAGQKADAVIVDDFCEVDFGEWTGLSWEQVAEKYRVSVYDWLRLLDDGGIPGAETKDAFRARVEVPLRAIMKRHAGRQTAILAHGGVIRMMLSILLDLPLHKTFHFEIEYASVTEIVAIPQKNYLNLLDFTPWRDIS